MWNKIFIILSLNNFLFAVHVKTPAIFGYLANSAAILSAKEFGLTVGPKLINILYYIFLTIFIFYFYKCSKKIKITKIIQFNPSCQNWYIDDKSIK